MNESGELWQHLPLFAPEGTAIPKLSEGQSAELVSSAMGALSHILHDEETPLEASELLRDEGNRHFKRGRKGYRSAIVKYTDAIVVAADVPEALAPALLNRSMAEFKLENYGRALRDVERSLALDPGNVKARYRAVLCALELEKFKVALSHCDEALALLRNESSTQAKSDIALFKKQKQAIEKSQAQSDEHAKERESRVQAATERRNAFEEMIQSRGITMGLPLFGQQRRYSTTEPVLNDNTWYWPVLLVYPEEVASPGNGDQSDFLEDIAETTTMEDILETVFAEGLPPPQWDRNRMYSSAKRLQMRYRARWTMETVDADSDDEETFCGSELPPDEVGPWIDVSSRTTLQELLRQKTYVTPMFPVLYVVPKEVELS